MNIVYVAPKPLRMARKRSVRNLNNQSINQSKFILVNKLR